MSKKKSIRLKQSELVVIKQLLSGKRKHEHLMDKFTLAIKMSSEQIDNNERYRLGVK